MEQIQHQYPRVVLEVWSFKARYGSHHEKPILTSIAGNLVTKDISSRRLVMTEQMSNQRPRSRRPKSTFVQDSSQPPPPWSGTYVGGSATLIFAAPASSPLTHRGECGVD